jgi:hypothetical protein
VSATGTKIKPDMNKLFPNSRRIYAAGEIYSGLRVPFREVILSPTKLELVKIVAGG